MLTPDKPLKERFRSSTRQIWQFIVFVLFVDDVSSEKKRRRKRKKTWRNGEANVTMDTTVNTSHEGIYCRLVEVYNIWYDPRHSI
jgi:hypothetical protein